MAKFRVETPDGTYEVEAPEGTTEEQIKAEIAKTQEIDRPEINKFAESARKIASGALFQFADEAEANARTADLKTDTATSTTHKDAYNELTALIKQSGYGGRTPEQKARIKELTNILKGEKQIKADVREETYKGHRDQLRRQSKEFEDKIQNCDGIRDSRWYCYSSIWSGA